MIIKCPNCGEEMRVFKEYEGQTLNHSISEAKACHTCRVYFTVYLGSDGIITIH